LICAALAIGPGDEVVVPSLTFAATAAAVVHAGARPVFADVRSATRPWLSVDEVRAALGPRTRAVVNVSYGGHPGEVRELRSLTDDAGVALIEDAAHAFDARLEGQAVGTFGVLGAYSFFANKNLVLGEGGMVVTGDRDLADRIRLLRSHGMTAGTWSRHTGSASSYEVREPGFNFRLDEPRAALGTALLRRLRADNLRRAELAAGYADALRAVSRVRPVLEPADHLLLGWHIYPVLLDAAVDRDDFRARLGSAGVQTSVHYPPLHLSEAFARCPCAGALTATEGYAARTVTLPLFPHMTAEQQAHVVETVAAALRT
jgi:dTDP-4-amino-4,6-dideoxygalactose transaminase